MSIRRTRPVMLPESWEIAKQYKKHGRRYGTHVPLEIVLAWAYSTMSLPTMPASLWPGIEQ
jgi:hypothetical protein